MNHKNETYIDKLKCQNLITTTVVKSILLYRAGIKEKITITNESTLDFSMRLIM